MSRLNRTVGIAVLVALAGATLAAVPVAAQDDATLLARARGIHERVLTLDTHNDIDPALFTPACNYTMRLTSQVNLPKMKEGGLDVSFMIVYTGQGPLTTQGYATAYREAIEKFDAIHRLTEQIAPEQVGLARSPEEVRAIAASGRKVVVIGVENGYPIGLDIQRVKEFYDRGGRYMSLAHNGNSQLSDSNTGERDNQWLYGGLSPLGRQVIAEMNRLGMMIDVSHPSKGSMMQAIALSKAPIIASHSSARALADVSRNMDDEMLAALKQNGGVIQTVAFASYVKIDPPQRGPALAALRQEFGIGAQGGRGGAPFAGPGPGGGRPPAGERPCPVEGQTPTGGVRRGGQGFGGPAPVPASLSAERRAQYEQRLAEIDRQWPPAGRATVKDFVDHIDYLVKRVGIDHVGISSDFDGGGGVVGWNSAAETMNVTTELVRRGYAEPDIAKLWSGNLLRVWSEVERVAKGIQAGTIK